VYFAGRLHVPAGQKARLALLLAYFVSPMDAVPEGIVGPAFDAREKWTTYAQQE
jgi:uncharacterized membrane protein YkvA (DUF1232 family)